MIPTPPALAPFDLLLGTWHVSREIPGHASAHGNATVHPVSPDEARYDEQVTLRLLSGPNLQGSAAYLFRRQPHGFDVLFPHTMQLFHQLHFTSEPTGILIANAIHRCVADLYHSTYRLHPSGIFRIEHRVRGPHKDYLSHTTLTRA